MAWVESQLDTSVGEEDSPEMVLFRNGLDFCGLASDTWIRLRSGYFLGNSMSETMKNCLKDLNPIKSYTVDTVESSFCLFSGLVVNESKVSNLFHSFYAEVIETKDLFEVQLSDTQRKVSDVNYFDLSIEIHLEIKWQSIDNYLLYS